MVENWRDVKFWVGGGFASWNRISIADGRRLDCGGRGVGRGAVLFAEFPIVFMCVEACVTNTRKSMCVCLEQLEVENLEFACVRAAACVCCP